MSFTEAALKQVVMIESSTKATKQTKSKKTDTKEVTAASLVNFLNQVTATSESNDRAEKNTLANPCKKIVFKEFGKNVKESDNVIDINKFKGLSEVKNAYKIINSYNEKVIEKKEDKEESEQKADSRTLTKLIYDPLMRGYVSMAEEKFITPKKRVKKSEDETVTEEHDEEDVDSNVLQRAIDTLELPLSKVVTIEDAIEAIRKVSFNEDTFKVKSFNQVFPLGVHNPEKDAGMVNNKYLQHMIPYFDEILEFIVENIDDELLRFHVIEQALILSKPEFDRKHASQDDYSLRIQYATFLRRFEDKPEKLVELVKDCVAYNKKAGNEEHCEKVVKDIIKKMHVFTMPKKNQFVLDAEATFESMKLDKEMFEVIYNLRKYLSFVDLILDGKQHHEMKSKSVIDYEDVYARYEALYRKHSDFVKQNQDIEPTVENLVTFMVKSLKFINSFKSDDVKTQQTASIFNDEHVIFKVNIKLMKELKKCYELSYDKISAAIHKLFTTDFKDIAEDLSAICVTETIKNTPAENANIFAKIGEIANIIKDVQINKNTRISIGLAIVKYVIERTNLILHRESSKKSNITIFVKI